MLGQDCRSSTASMAFQAIAFIQNVTSHTHCYVTSGISMTGKVSDFQGGKRGSYSDTRFKMKFLHAVLPVVILALASGTALARDHEGGGGHAGGFAAHAASGRMSIGHAGGAGPGFRSEEHTSELQSLRH